MSKGKNRYRLQLPARVVTLDCDGTIFDPWACCNRSDDEHLGTEKCRHLRRDTIKRAREMATKKDAEFVILSWRFHRPQTAQWLSHVGIYVTNEFTLGSPDLRAIDPDRKIRTDIQWGYKAGVVKRLQEMGVDVVASFDDNADVCHAIELMGNKAVHVKHMRTVNSKEFNSRYGDSADAYNYVKKSRMNAYAAT